MDPGGGAEMSQSNVRVLRDQRVGPARPRGRVELEQRGEVVRVRDRDQMVDGPVVRVWKNEIKMK